MRTRSTSKEYQQKRRVGITCHGITLTATEWSRMPNVMVAGNTIRLRLKKGMTPEQAIYGDKATHKSINAQGYQPKYRNAYVEQCKEKLKRLRAQEAA
ncbi:hypothetical protein [Xenorhabdus anantnagensis]|uniref:Integrase n=1 Tax=Xenorhabdus anantnagensis TaxID=3025875 RepID=A0ABT5LZ00_9GAMM|nr:hypothetical protein [Xenorhabdus anantnagensis]MDC9598986.1 hypothetical protein [Xenorhabdus anantnagensis]